MKFHHGFWLLALPFVLGLSVWLLRWGARQRRVALDRVIAARLHETLLRSVDYGRRRFKHILFVVSMVLLMAALARPLWGTREAEVEHPGVDCILLLDVSRSMLAEDVTVAKGITTNRLGAAKSAIDRLIALPSGNRYGLVTFSGDAYLMSPVTQDHHALQRSLGAVHVGAISKPGTDMAAAIKLAAKSFDPEQKAGKALIVVTDGEELQGDAVIAAREAVRNNVAIFTAGVGSVNGGRIPERQYGQLRFSKNEFGRDVTTRLNERVLQQVAAAGHGFYKHLGATGEGLVEIQDEGLRPLPKARHTRKTTDRREFFQWPLACCLGLVLWEMLVSERRKNDNEIQRK